jgi:hypothetical protein
VNTNELELRLRAALDAAAQGVTPDQLHPASVPTRRGKMIWIAPALVAAAVLVVALAVALGTGSPRHAKVGNPPAASTSGTSTPTTTSAPTGPSAPTSAVPDVTPTPAGYCLPGERCPAGITNYPAIWPFSDYGQAVAWQQSSGGQQPWHADAGQTALLFTQSYLGFSDIDRVTSSTIGILRASIGVGYLNPAGQPHTAAVLTLLRYGDTSSGWEVVGTVSSGDLTLDTPDDLSAAGSPLTVGGRFTGVDGAIVVTVRNADGAVVGQVPGPVAAGGQATPWHGTVSFNGTVSFTGSGQLLVVASAGGHTTAHEQFAIQPLHT